MAAKCGKNVTVTRFLDKYGASAVDVRDEKGETALIHAASFGWGKTVALLLKKGADIDAQDNEGYTALIATLSEDVTVLLLKKGANIDLKNKNGETAQMNAYECRLPELEDLLERWAKKREKQQGKNNCLVLYQPPTVPV